MKALCENDATRGRGHARFCCTEVTHPADAAAQYSFSLCRASDQTFLARTGWQNGEEQHSPEDQHMEGDRLILTVGPNIVDSLDENENYRLTLHAPGLPPQRAAFSIAQINRSLRGTAGSLQMPAAAAVAAEPQPEPAPQPAPPAEEPPIDAPEPQPAKNVLPMVLAVLLVLALAGGGAWWFMQNKASEQAATEEVKPAEKPAEAATDKKDEPTPAGQPPSEATSEAEKAPETAPDKAKPKTEQAAPAPATPPAPLAVRERVRQYLGGSPSAPTASGAMTMARDMLAAPEGNTPETQDSVYRLYYYAQQQGDADAALELARSADPTQAPWGSLPKNAAEAWALYAVAAPQKPEAALAMQGLKQWLETETGKGNAKARAWIEEIARASRAD